MIETQRTEEYQRLEREIYNFIDELKNQVDLPYKSLPLSVPPKKGKPIYELQRQSIGFGFSVLNSYRRRDLSHQEFKDLADLTNFAWRIAERAGELGWLEMEERLRERRK